LGGVKTMSYSEAKGKDIKGIEYTLWQPDLVSKSKTDPSKQGAFYVTMNDSSGNLAKVKVDPETLPNQVKFPLYYASDIAEKYMNDTKDNFANTKTYYSHGNMSVAGPDGNIITGKPRTDIEKFFINSGDIVKKIIFYIDDKPLFAFSGKDALNNYGNYISHSLRNAFISSNKIKQEEY
jgi:hypothetical protein